MTPQDMLDYTLGQLEGGALEQANRDMDADPELGVRCERLRQSLRLLLDEGPIELPPGLRARTNRLVSEYVEPEPRRLFRPIEFMPRLVPFRLADLAVAAGILMAGIMTLLPAVHRSKAAAHQAGCMHNLHQIGLGLGHYANTHRFYPAVEPEHYALSFAVKLKDNGFLTNLNVLDCPCLGTCDDDDEIARQLAEIRNPTDKSPLPLRVRCDYAYNIGVRAGEFPSPLMPTPSSLVPLVADRPGYDETGVILDGNSPNHNGRGQNILFQDQSVRWYRMRRINQDDDVYLNRDHRPSYGLGESDHVLIPGTFKVILR